MKNFFKSLAFSTTLVLGVLIINAFVGFQQPTSWEVPDDYKAMKNPIKKTDKVMAEGKTLFGTYCADCHGINGKGDGKKSEHLSKVPANLSLSENQNESDGSHFFKIKIGRKGLHSFQTKLKDDEIWEIVYHLHTLGKNN
jgi:mono/diheme cytochrome c family protein